MDIQKNTNTFLQLFLWIFNYWIKCKKRKLSKLHIFIYSLCRRANNAYHSHLCFMCKRFYIYIYTYCGYRAFVCWLVIWYQLRDNDRQIEAKSPQWFDCGFWTHLTDGNFRYDWWWGKSHCGKHRRTRRMLI